MELVSLGFLATAWPNCKRCGKRETKFSSGCSCISYRRSTVVVAGYSGILGISFVVPRGTGAERHSFHLGPAAVGFNPIVGATDSEPALSCRHERPGRRILHLAAGPDERRQRIFHIYR